MLHCLAAAIDETTKNHLELSTSMVAGVAELVDARDLKSLGHFGCAGSSPASGTTFYSLSLNTEI